MTNAPAAPPDSGGLERLTRFGWERLIQGERGPSRASTRHVLLAIASHVGRGTLRGWPSLRTLVAETRLSRETVRTAIALAVREGWIERRWLKAGGMTQPGYSYQLRLPGGLTISPLRGLTISPPEDPGAGLTRAPGGLMVRLWEGQPLDPNSSRTVVENRDDPRGSSASAGTSPERLRHPEPSPARKTSKAKTATKTPVSECFEVYRVGILRLYRADYPRSARASGQLAQLVARLGAQNALTVIATYLQSENPFYGKVRHSLDILVRDCERLYLESQQPAGPARAATMRIYYEVENGRRGLVTECPAGEPREVAQRVLREYQSAPWMQSARFVITRLDGVSHRFDVDDLKRAT